MKSLSMIKKYNKKQFINEKDLTINPEILITLKKYERWRNSQNRGRNLRPLNYFITQS